MVLAMKSRLWPPLSVRAVSMRTGIISGSGRISIAPEPPGAKPRAYRTVFSIQAPYSAYPAPYRDALAGRLDGAADVAPVWCIFDNTALGAATADALAVLE